MIDMRTAALGLFCLTFGGVLWLKDSRIREQAGRIAGLERSMESAIAANRRADAAITRLERSANATAAVTAAWAARDGILSSTGRNAAIAISEAANHVPQSRNPLDAALPDALVRPLDRLYREARAAADSVPDDGSAASGLPAPGESDTGASGGGTDPAQTGAVGGGASGNPG